jgi:hypothetical protein
LNNFDRYSGATMLKTMTKLALVAVFLGSLVGQAAGGTVEEGEHGFLTRPALITEVASFYDKAADSL